MEVLPRGTPQLEPLTKRERQVYKLVVEGLSNKEIANLFSVAEKTIKFHLSNIFAKLECSSRAKLIVRHYQAMEG